MAQPRGVVTQLAPQAQCVPAWGTPEKFDGAKGGDWIVTGSGRKFWNLTRVVRA